LIIAEAGSELVTTWLRDDPEVVIWGWTRVELASAVERRAREGRLNSAERRSALQRIERVANDAHEVLDLSAVRTRAAVALARHSLRAADAGQLAAALLVAEPLPSSLAMVVLDRRLADAAEREGLSVLSWLDR
jgi:hypothetical protein